jgi:hypothetical protein
MIAVDDPCRPELLGPLLAALAAEGLYGELCVRGSSMRPLLRDGDRIRLLPSDATRVRVGDVVARGGSAGLIVHRVVGWWPTRQGWRLLTRGDHAWRLDPPLRAEEVAGRVIARLRGGQEWRLDGGGARLAGRGRAALSLALGLLAEVWDRRRCGGQRPEESSAP